MTNTLFTIGHSTHPTEHFVALLQQHAITTLYDVRSTPYSRYNPQYNRETLQKELQKHHIKYHFLGKELGAHRENPNCYGANGKVQYSHLLKDPPFQQGIQTILQETQQKPIALMCAEKDPLQCHRTIFICRNIRNKIPHIQHILADGSLEPHPQTEQRLLQKRKMLPNLFQTELEDAYDSSS